MPGHSIILVDRFSVELCRAQPEVLFVFGDNLAGKGKGGQAIIRGEPNAFGIPTKRLPARTPDAYFADRDDECQALMVALRTLYGHTLTRPIALPRDGLGTGLAEMPERSPRLYATLRQVLHDHFANPYGDAGPFPGAMLAAASPTTQVVNKKRGEAYDVYIGRGSPFGNPFVIGRDGDRLDVIRKYRSYFHAKLRTEPEFVHQVEALRGKRLGCFCKPAACHGDVIAEHLDGPAPQSSVAEATELDNEFESPVY